MNRKRFPVARWVRCSFRGVVLLLLFSLAQTAAAETTFALSEGWMGDLTFDGGALYMTTMAGARAIIKIDPATGAILATIYQDPYGTDIPRGAASDGAGHLFLTSMAPYVCEFETDGTRLNCFTVPDPVPNGADGFRTGAIAFDGTNLYIGDTDTGTVLVTDRAGAFIRHFQSNRRPEGLVFDSSTGHLWSVDVFATDKMTEITTNGDFVRSCDIAYRPGRFGHGGIALAGSKFYISEPVNPDSPGDGTRIHVLDRNSLVCTPSLVLEVAIDIKPGSFPNSINLSSAGVVPVAILSSSTFDASQVDPATVTLAGAAVKLIGKGDKYSCSSQDVNEDGLPDLVCHVTTAQFMIEPGDSVAVLEAKTVGGQPIRGQDSVNIVP